jgi:6-phosphogluconolactonase
MNEAAGAAHIEAFANREVLAEAAASAIAEQLDLRLCEGAARARFAATGGSTPRAAYERLRNWPIDWSRVDITLGDERWAPPASPDSNQGMLEAELLKGGAAAARFVPLWSDEASPEQAAAEAETGIASLLPFDLVLLGMGEDGHFASLFPGSPALAEGLDPAAPRLCIAVPAGDPAPALPRISLTLRALLDARLIVLLITGEAKRRTLEAALAGADLPARALLLQDRAPVRILWAP